MNNLQKVKSIKKILSANDLGLTGGHQAGILIPKREDILSFFPRLTVAEKNPRFILRFYDDLNEPWVFTFIYYNNKFFGGTRNEYRLTGMTRFLRTNNLKVGDEISLVKEEGNKRIFFTRGMKISNGKLKLSGTWKVITI